MRWLYAVPIAVLGFAFSSAAVSQSDLQRFEAQLKPGLGLAFAMYKMCTMTTMLDSKRKGASFAASEIAVARACKPQLDKDFRYEATQAKLTRERQDSILETFASLALEERRLFFAGKPIPGETVSPETAALMACVETKEARERIQSCFVANARPLVQSRDEQPEKIATAVEGTCELPISQLRNQLMACMSFNRAHEVVEIYVKSMRNAVISAVVQARAARP
jgi:hypothetical protein